MSQVVIPAVAAAVVAAPLVECALNTSVFIPTCVRVVLSHLAMVEEQTGLCGLIRARNNLSSPRFPFVRSQCVHWTQ